MSSGIYVRQRDKQTLLVLIHTLSTSFKLKDFVELAALLADVYCSNSD